MAIPDAFRYEIRIDRVDLSQANVLTDSMVTSTSYQVHTPLVSAGTYLVWILAINIRGEVGVWSRSLSFTVASSDPGSSGADLLLNGIEGDGVLADEAFASLIQRLLKTGSKPTLVSLSIAQHSAEPDDASEANQATDNASVAFQRIDGPAEPGLSPHVDLVNSDGELDSLIQSIADNLLL